MQNKTVIESRAEDLAKLRYPEDAWPRFSEQYQIVFKEGFKAALELPEVKAMRDLLVEMKDDDCFEGMEFNFEIQINKALSSFDKLFEVGK